ncbi:hypothetical protein TRFO_29297 [Tritrichomonas foetus]|uniref:UBA domain-containing protein n=1 Tax=Tritrichomonas foetus TaxID=1144522 RepID=A0A1J4JW07_9EUKA|nr:hypothetical protein TRFO_29297 [Tritrichomonas foetus]|eukprot:OHT03321.1 hypothetical protein TRFO_29297 [Tritrichomonas foetus]
MSDEEVIIGDDDDEIIDMESSQSIPVQIDNEKVIKQIQQFDNFLPHFHGTLEDSFFSFQIPSKVLPLSLQTVCGFTSNPILLDCTIHLKNLDWKETPYLIDIKHPLYSQNYVGRPLIQEAVRAFFSSSYCPRSTYKSSTNVFYPVGIVDLKKVETLVNEGFDPNSAEKALILNNNNLNKCRTYLLTGSRPEITLANPVSYFESPPVYLVLEIVECFLDLSDHCCVCRKSLHFSGIKPQVCDNKLCYVSSNEIGVGTSVTQEIKRDPLAADFIISVFSGSFKNSKYTNPAPPDEIMRNARNILSNNMPSMKDIVQNCTTDKDISKFYGKDVLDLLRWILLSNRSQVISLTKEMRIKDIPTKYQFMTLIASPEAELKFLNKKIDHGSTLLWHGSSGERWHSILRNGLKNMSNTSEMIHGAALGPGIYFGKISKTSLLYSSGLSNLYTNSELGSFYAIALCEVAKVSSLINHGHIYTLGDEDACIVRFMFAIQKEFISYTKHIELPTLEDVLAFQGKMAQQDQTNKDDESEDDFGWNKNFNENQMIITNPIGGFAPIARNRKTNNRFLNYPLPQPNLSHQTYNNNQFIANQVTYTPYVTNTNQQINIQQQSNEQNNRQSLQSTLSKTSGWIRKNVINKILNKPNQQTTTQTSNNHNNQINNSNKKINNDNNQINNHNNHRNNATSFNFNYYPSNNQSKTPIQYISVDDDDDDSNEDNYQQPVTPIYLQNSVNQDTNESDFLYEEFDSISDTNSYIDMENNTNSYSDSTSDSDSISNSQIISDSDS